MKKLIDEEQFKAGYLNPNGSYRLIKKVDNGFYYLFLNEIDERYIKLHNRFVYLRKETKRVEITLQLLWDTMHVYDDSKDNWDTTLMTQMSAFDLYTKHMKISWILREKDKIKLNNYKKYNKK